VFFRSFATFAAFAADGVMTQCGVAGAKVTARVL
jgi:hypothetical protein